MRIPQKNKVLALILATVMLFTAVPISHLIVSAEKPSSVVILHNGERTSGIVLQEDGAEILVADAQVDVLTYSWQLLFAGEGDLWVTIDDCTKQECVVTYALVKSNVNRNAAAYLRCVASDGNETYISDAVAVNISYKNTAPTDSLIASKTKAAAFKKSAARTVALNNNQPDETYNIEIRYLHTDGKEAWTSEKFNIQSGTSLDTQITLPKVVGYTASNVTDENGNEVDSKLLSISDDNSILNIQLSDVMATLIFNVIYTPNATQYKVVHHLQNLDSDGYGITITKYFFGETGSLTVGDNGESLLHKVGDDSAAVNYDERFKGFSYLAYSPLTIAADGQTTVDIYYNRNYYIVDYVYTDGGYGVEPIAVRYGTQVFTKNPTRHGWDFGGWELIGVGEIADTMTAPTNEQKAEFDFGKGSITVPDYNLRFRPIWIRDNSSFTVVYWREAETADADGNIQYEYWGSKAYGYNTLTDGSHQINGQIKTGDTVTPDTNIPNSTTTAYKIVPSDISKLTDSSNIDESNYFHYNEEKTKAENTSVIVEGDGTSVLNIYYDRNEYTLKFYYAAMYNNSYYVMGRTNRFGTEAPNYVRNANDRNNEIKLFDGAWGDQKRTISELPKVINKQINGVNRYELGTDHGASNRTYYYFTFKAKYGTDISAYWPTTKDIPAMSGGNQSRDMVFSAWDGEYNVYYTQHANDEHNRNETIKGEYRRLDHQLLWDPARNQTNSDNTVTYLAYWCNVSSYDYNYPSLYRYNIYLECLNQHAAGTTCVDCEGHSPKTFTTTADVTKSYYLVSTYDVADNNDTSGNNNLQQQSHPKVYGFVNVNNLNGTGLTNRTEYNTISLTSDEERSYRNGYEIFHFYDRERYDLKFNNNGEYLLNVDADGNFTENLTIRYDVKIGVGETYDLNEIYENGVLKYYPKNLEVGGYEFEGWYSSPTFAVGTKFEFKETDTMPAHDMELYAHWVKKRHKVYIYYSEDDYINEKPHEFQYANPAIVLHGEAAHTPGDPPTSPEGQAFSGWYYKDTNGIEQRFVFSIPILRDMHIYAKYNYNIAVEYTVVYILADGYETYNDGSYKLDSDGNRIPKPKLDDQDNVTYVAKPTQASGLVDTHITVFAKVGAEMYEDYREGYFPEPITQDLHLSTTADDNYKIVYYSERKDVPYSVSYVDKNGNPIDSDQYPTEEHMNNNYNIVTESFLPIDGYVPNAIQQRFVISADMTDENANGIPDKNEFSFVYTKAQEDDIIVQVIEYEQNLDGTYSEIEGKNNMFYTIESGTDFTYTVTDRTGFNLAKARTRVNGATVTNANWIGNMLTRNYVAGGLLIEIYHDRQIISYTIEHRENTIDGELLEAPVTIATGMFGETVYADSKSFIGYHLLGEETRKSLTLELQQEGQNNPQSIVFTYAQDNVNYTFQASVNGKVFETTDWLSAYSSNTTSFADPQTVHGSKAEQQPTAADGTVYIFDGWFYDAACTQPVDASWFDEATLRITPQKISIGENAIYQSDNFYAKYKPYLVDLTIATQFWVGEGQYSSLDPNKTFIFRVTGEKGTQTENIDLYVTVHGKGSVKIVDLPAGNYTVSTNAGWSWRYKAYKRELQTEVPEPTRNITLTESGTIQTFVPVREKIYWLDGCNYQVNVFGAVN